ncbi:MAG: hypothetical protein ACKN9V_03910 [Pseudomonadota bacterium]
MKSLIGEIDAALGSLYDIDTTLKSADFISEQDHLKQPGALLIRNREPQSNDIEVAIAFNSQVKSVLHTLSTDTFLSWDLNQSRAFSVAAEEISHFRYFVFHSGKDRQVSHLELEFHGEIDKFLMFHLLAHNFDFVFTKLFENFSISPVLNAEEQERYHTANQLAREFILKNKNNFNTPQKFPDLLKDLRALYRMSPQEKFSLKHRF